MTSAVLTSSRNTNAVAAYMIVGAVAKAIHQHGVPRPTWLAPSCLSLCQQAKSCAFQPTTSTADAPGCMLACKFSTVPRPPGHNEGSHERAPPAAVSLAGDVSTSRPASAGVSAGRAPWLLPRLHIPTMGRRGII